MNLGSLKDGIIKLLYGGKYLTEVYNIEKARRIGLKVGSNCRFFSLNFSTEPYLIQIGNHVTITSGVHFITHDGGVWIFREMNPEIELFGKIVIGNNVFIGLNAIILLNTEIGDNTIIAAGSVVKGKFESNSVIAGIPAKRISSIEEYFKKNAHKFTYFRDLSPSDKTNRIQEHFNRSNVDI
jgi:acetyltransferase-like isoleucine patch superfamily enzyme